jgi:transcriptional regulator with XRE-family HTH domain
VANEKGVGMYPNLKLQLFKSGMRQNRLAQCLGMDESILSKIVNGFREPSGELRARIASLLESEEAWLFQRVDPPAPSKNGVEATPAPMRSTRSNGSA